MNVLQPKLNKVDVFSVQTSFLSIAQMFSSSKNYLFHPEFLIGSTQILKVNKVQMILDIQVRDHIYEIQFPSVEKS